MRVPVTADCKWELRSRRILLLCLLFSTLAGTPAWVAGVGYSLRSFPEHEVKAAFVFHFPGFVTFSGGPDGAAGAPTYCMVRGSDVIAPLTRLLEEEPARGTLVTLGDDPATASLAGCRILFIPHQAGEVLERWLARVEGRPVLTVSDAPDAARRGCVIGLTHKHDRVHPRINRAAARRQGLRISSRLLSISTLLPEPAADAP